MVCTVSVVMPAYNAASTIAASIESVLGQTFEDWELLIVDDGSSDATAAVVARYEGERRIKYVSLPQNVGMAAARNVGARRAGGEFLAFLDSDDLWSDTKLERQMGHHDAHPYIAASHTDFVVFTPGGREHRPWRQALTRDSAKAGNLLPLLYYNNVVGTLTVVVLRSLFLELGGFDSGLYGIEDQDLWIRICKAGYEFGFVPQRLSQYRITASGASKGTGKYRRSVRRFLRQRVLADPTVPEDVRKKALAAYYMMFGRLYQKSGRYSMAWKAYGLSLRSHHIDIWNVAALAIFAGVNLMQLLGSRLRRATDGE